MKEEDLEKGKKNKDEFNENKNKIKEESKRKVN